MPDPISTSRIDAQLLPLEAGATPSPSLLPAGGLEGLYDGVSSLIGCGAPSGAAGAEQLEALLDAYREGGGGGVHALLHRDPELRAALGRMSPEQLECALASVDAEAGERPVLPPWRTEAESVAHLVREHFDGLVHSYTLQEGQARVADALAYVDHLEAELPSRLEALRNAAPGSPDAALAEMLGVRGDEGDLARAEERLAQIRAVYTAFTQRLAGQTWTQSDFPAASLRALERMGLSDTAPGSIADLAAGEQRSELSQKVSRALLWVHGVVTGAELWHLRALGTLQLGGAGTVVAPLAASLVIESQLEARIHAEHAAFVRTGHALGM